MTSRQRLLAAIRHQETDRVPVSPRVGAFLPQYYGHGGWLYDLKAAREFDFDPLVTLGSPYGNFVRDPLADFSGRADVRVDVSIERRPDYTLYRRRIETPAGPLSDRMRVYRGGGIYGISPNPHWEERLAKDEGDLERLRWLLPEPEAAAFAPVVETQAEVGERGLVQLTIDSAIDHQAGWAYELVDLMVAAYEQPALVDGLLRLFQENTLRQTRCALEAGVEVIFTPWYFASLSAGWSPALFQRLFLPLVREQVELVHSFGAIYHYYDDGKCTTVLPWLADAGIDLISTVPPPPVGDIDLKAAKATVGGRVCLNGNVDLLNVIARGTPEFIRETVRQTILDAAPGGGFILGTSDSIRDAPIENVRAYFAAGREFGALV